jgi:hypothetical protein
LHEDGHSGADAPGDLSGSGEGRPAEPTGRDLSKSTSGLGSADDADPLSAPDDVARYEGRLLNSSAIDEDAIATAKIANGEERSVLPKLRVPTRDLGAGQDDVAGPFPPNDVTTPGGRAQEGRRKNPTHVPGPPT